MKFKEMKESYLPPKCEVYRIPLTGLLKKMSVDFDAEFEDLVDGGEWPMDYGQ